MTTRGDGGADDDVAVPTWPGLPAPPPPPPRPPPPPPYPPGPAPCAAASACNSECGETPSEFAEDAKLPTATAGQCYFCDKYRVSNAPGWCEYRYDGWTVDYCCMLHTCDGACAGSDAEDGGDDDGAVIEVSSPPAPPPPPPALECAASASCNSGCGEMPSDRYDPALLGLPPAEAGSCYFCDTYLFSDAPDWCTWRWDAPMFESDLCCVKHECSGACASPPPRPPVLGAGGARAPRRARAGAAPRRSARRWQYLEAGSRSSSRSEAEAAARGGASAAAAFDLLVAWCRRRSERVEFVFAAVM